MGAPIRRDTMINLRNMLQRNTSWNTFDTSEDVANINTLLFKFGLVVSDCINSPTCVTYVISLNVDSKIKTLLNLEKNFAIAVNDNNCRVYQDGNRLCIEKRGADNIIRMGDLYVDKFIGTDKPVMMLGKDNTGANRFCDLSKAPHVLIGGTTGSGKSMFLHSLLLSLLMNHDVDMNFIVIDPKGTEFTWYQLLNNCKVIGNAQSAIYVLNWLCEEMDRRYSEIAKAGCRDIDSFTAKGNRMVRTVCVIDELADLMITAPKDCEQYIVRLAQKARACGIHLIIATQRPSVKVVTGLIKANIPTRVGLKTVSAIDSRIILDRSGAEKLNGKGDMLFLANGSFEPIRIQAPLVTEDEMKAIPYMCATKDRKAVAI